MVMPLQAISSRGQHTTAGQTRDRLTNSIDGDRWYAVYTLPNKEECARNHLVEQGLEAFLPAFSKHVRHARQEKCVRAPLFSRYLFVKVDLRRCRWRSINNTVGVSSLVMQNDAPVPVPRGLVEALQESVGVDGCVSFPKLRAGQSVRVVSGPLKERLGVLERLSGSERVWVLFDLMNARVRINMSLDSLAAG